MRSRSERLGIYRNAVEKAVGDQLSELGLLALYEVAKLGYILHRRYTPDFTFGDTHHIEVKGWWEPSDRAKLLAVIHANPTTKVLVALQNPNLTIAKKSKTTYAQWCEKHGIQWCPIPIPPDALMAWLGLHICPAQGQTVTPQMVRPGIQTDLFSVLSVQADTTETDQNGNGQ